MREAATGFAGIGEEFLPLQRLYRWERERADRIFLSQPAGGRLRDWTWAEAAGEVRRIAAYLRSQGWAPGSNVAILSKNCAWWVMADLAIWMAGHVTVPIYASLRPDSIRQILEHSQSKACFLGPTEEADMAADMPPGVSAIRFPNAPAGPGPGWNSLIAGCQPLAGEPTRAAGEVATIFYTSGTTGLPKGVMQTFRAFSFLTWALLRRFDLPPEGSILSYLPLAHILERGGEELPAILLGWRIFFTERPETFLADLRRARPTAVFLSVPRLLLKFQQGVFERLPSHKLDRMLRLPVAGPLIGKRILAQLGLDAVRYAACGGAALPVSLMLWYRGLGLNLVEGYGLTEGMITHLNLPDNPRAGWVGRPLEGVEAKRSEQGELLLRSPMNMAGYYRDPDSTNDAFTPDGFLRTGDLVEVEPDGQTRIVGRIKEQFKTSKGKYVAPSPIELKLGVHPDIESCCLMGAGLANPFAVAVLSPEGRQKCEDPERRVALERSLGGQLHHLNLQLDAHERLMFIAIVDGPWTVSNGLVTPTLKLRRTPLEERYLGFVDHWMGQERQVVWEPQAKVRVAGRADAA